MTYYDPKDLRKFGNITDWVKHLGTKFLITTEKFLKKEPCQHEKNPHCFSCSTHRTLPYCIDAYTQDGLQRGITKEEMMEAVHVGAAIKSGASLVHGVMMMNKANKLEG